MEYKNNNNKKIYIFLHSHRFLTLMLHKYFRSVSAERHLMNNKDIHVVERGKILLVLQQTYLSWFCSLKEIRECSEKVGTGETLLKHHLSAGNASELLRKTSKKIRIWGHCMPLKLSRIFLTE